MIDLESEKKKKYCRHDDFLKFNFSHFTPQVIIFFVQKKQPKFRSGNLLENGNKNR